MTNKKKVYVIKWKFDDSYYLDETMDASSIKDAMHFVTEGEAEFIRDSIKGYHGDPEFMDPVSQFYQVLQVEVEV